jgi:hypothetical protein
MCGGDVEINKSAGIGVCEYCGSQQPLSQEDQQQLSNALKMDALQKKAEINAANKKKNKKWLPIFLILIVASIGLNIFNTTVTRIYDVQMTSALDEYNDPVDEVYTYEADADVLMMTARITNAKNTTFVQAVWKCNGEIIRQGDEIRLTSDDRHIYFYIERGKSKWTKGAYEAEIYLNGSEKPAKTISFTVE